MSVQLKQILIQVTDVEKKRLARILPHESHWDFDFEDQDTQCPSADWSSQAKHTHM